jgi:excisionase family DNA binding protein
MRLGVSERVVRQMVADGRLRDHRVGGRRGFRLDVIELDELKKAGRKYETLNQAMDAKDDLGEAELRYKLLAEAFESMPQLRSQLNAQLERAKAEIGRLRALAPKDETTTSSDSGKVVAIDANRFRKSS